MHIWHDIVDTYITAFQNRRSKTVRYIFPAFAVTALFLGLASISSQNASYISITTPQEVVREGERISIEVKANAHTPVNAVDIVLTYPKEQLSIESIDTGTSVITLWAEDPKAQNGKITLRGGVFQRGFLGEHTIAVIKGKALTEGSLVMALDTVSLIAGDGKGTPVPAEKVADGTIRVVVEPKDGALKSEVSVALVTDIDNDGSIGVSDINSFMKAWFTRSKSYDFNNDGVMSFRDFSILLSDSFFK